MHLKKGKARQSGDRQSGKAGRTCSEQVQVGCLVLFLRLTGGSVPWRGSLILFFLIEPYKVLENKGEVEKWCRRCLLPEWSRAVEVCELAILRQELHVSRWGSWILQVPYQNYWVTCNSDLEYYLEDRKLGFVPRSEKACVSFISETCALKRARERTPSLVIPHP